MYALYPIASAFAMLILASCSVILPLVAVDVLWGDATPEGDLL